ncbi:MAG TPA: 30S ribosomal protein S4 [Candidatus Kapabacteria bacterium]|nr:30S ribosomal protein S4 [Candidatus Kapabacteria bacterium]HPO62882.1 30S ribosomal protein S4 [Candidatus Kapabacteria bacterium]
MNYTGPKVKLSRKLGIELTIKSSKYSSKKPYPPGQHGASKRRAKQSDYGKQLLEKQRLRLQYNISEKQMRNYYAKAASLLGNTGDLLIQLLEARLDSVLYRSGFTRSIYAARQFITHGHILVDGKRVTIPSYSLKPNQTISIKPKSRKLECFQDAMRTATPPPYIELQKAEFASIFRYTPTREEAPVICEVPLVVEFYSR